MTRINRLTGIVIDLMEVTDFGNAIDIVAIHECLMEEEVSAIIDNLIQ